MRFADRVWSASMLFGHKVFIGGGILAYVAEEVGILALMIVFGGGGFLPFEGIGIFPEEGGEGC